MKSLLINYGAGNVHSVYKALSKVGFEVILSSDPAEAEKAEVLVLPGQGHFRQVSEAFAQSGFEPVVRQHIAQEKPFLGICVGLQLLMRSSEEAPERPGLGILNGVVKRFDDPKVSIPQMGWNQIYSYGQPALLKDIPEGSFAYYCNSYYVDFDDVNVPGAITHYGHTTFKSVISQGHLHATQFHPEKSQALGLKILSNFHQIAQCYV
ncbi:MAG: imidazole glycerol phosphate synthase subunit HisH [Deinococcales bacterium]